MNSPVITDFCFSDALNKNSDHHKKGLTLIYGVNQKSTYIYIYRTFRSWSLEFSNTTGALKFIRGVFLLLHSVKVPGGSYRRSASPRTESALLLIHRHISRCSTVRKTANVAQLTSVNSRQNYSRQAEGSVCKNCTTLTFICS